MTLGRHLHYIATFCPELSFLDGQHTDYRGTEISATQVLCCLSNVAEVKQCTSQHAEHNYKLTHLSFSNRSYALFLYISTKDTNTLTACDAALHGRTVSVQQSQHTQSTPGGNQQGVQHPGDYAGSTLAVAVEDCVRLASCRRAIGKQEALGR